MPTLYIRFYIFNELLFIADYFMMQNRMLIIYFLKHITQPNMVGAFV
jgi:hypothetical protein